MIFFNINVQVLLAHVQLLNTSFLNLDLLDFTNHNVKSQAQNTSKQSLD